MKRVVLFFFLFILSIALLIHFVGGVMLTNLVERSLVSYESKNPHVTISYSDLNISPLFANANVIDLEFSDTQSGMAVSAARLNSNFSLTSIISGAINDFSSLDQEKISFTIHANNFSFQNEQNSFFVNAEAMNLEWNGSITDLITNSRQQSGSLINWNTQFEFSQVSFSDHISNRLSELSDFLPEINRIHQINGNMHYNAEEQSLDIRHFRFDAVETKFQTHGSITYADGSSLTEPESASLPLQFESPVRPGFRQTISAEIGEITCSFIRLESRLSYENGQPVLSEGETFIRMDEPILYPSQQFLNQYQIMLQSLPINPREIAAQYLEITYINNDNNISVVDSELSFPAFDIGFSGQAERIENMGQSTWENGRLRISNASRQTEEFIQNFQILLDIELERDGQDYVIPVTGTISRPKLSGFGV